MEAGWILLILATLWLAFFGSVPGRSEAIDNSAAARDVG